MRRCLDVYYGMKMAHIEYAFAASWRGWAMKGHPGVEKVRMSHGVTPYLRFLDLAKAADACHVCCTACLSRKAEAAGALSMLEVAEGTASIVAGIERITSIAVCLMQTICHWEPDRVQESMGMMEDQRCTIYEQLGSLTNLSEQLYNNVHI